MPSRSFYAQSGNSTDGGGESYSAEKVRKATADRVGNARRAAERQRLAEQQSRATPN